MLTNRQNEILKLIVLEYIKLAKPVGSNLICDRLKCSSATIRSEMAALEELGLLEKTHTSSGRVPSEEGYRYYVDHLMKLKEISAEDMLKLQLIFNNNQLELSDCLKKSLEIVSDITNYTSVVLGNKSHENTLKEVNIVPLSNSSMTVIVITDKGFVEHKTINVNGISLEEIKKTVNLINNLIIGTPIDEVSSKLEFEIKPIIGNYVKEHERLYNVFYNVFTNFTNRNVDVVGKNSTQTHTGQQCAFVHRADVHGVGRGGLLHAGQQNVYAVQADPVEHDAGDDLVDVELGLQEAGDGTQQGAGQNGTQQAHPPGQLQPQGHIQAGTCAHHILTGDTDVEQAGLVGEQHGQGAHQQGNSTGQGLAQVLHLQGAGVAEEALQNRPDGLKGTAGLDDQKHQITHDHAAQDHLQRGLLLEQEQTPQGRKYGIEQFYGRYVGRGQILQAPAEHAVAGQGAEHRRNCN